MLKLPTLTEITSEWDRLPAVAVTVMVKSRLGVNAVVDIVSVAMLALLGLRVSVVVLRITVGPFAIIGLIVMVSVTVPAKPRLFTTMVELRDEPALSIIDSGLESTVKSPAGGDVTVRETLTLWDSEPLVAVTVTV